MADLEYREMQEVLRKHDFHFKKKYGQNFLIKPDLLHDIVDGAEVTDEDTVVEIGPGVGSLTRVLADRAKQVYAIEVDEKLIPILDETMAGYDNVTIINEDVLKADLTDIFAQGRVKVVANLPYYITTPIILGLLEKDLDFESITVMVQKEVAERMQAVVKAYVECGNFGPVQEEQEKILAAYIDDIHKYAEKVDVPKIENCYRAIPRILAKDNRKFKYSEVEKNGSERKFGESIEWLKDAALAPLAENVVVPELPLSANVREGWFKLYLSDIGLLSALYGLETKKLLYSGRLAGPAKGGLYENFVAGALQRKGYPLYYYKTLDGSREVEFVIEKDGGVIPIEVKATNGATVSLDETLLLKGVVYGYKFVDGNVGVSGSKITLPHFMCLFV